MGFHWRASIIIAQTILPLLVNLAVLAAGLGALLWAIIGGGGPAAIAGKVVLAGVCGIMWLATIFWCEASRETDAKRWDELEKQRNRSDGKGSQPKANPIDDRRVLPLLTYEEANIIPPRDSRVSPPAR